MKVEKEKEMLRDHLQKLRTREQQSDDYLAQMVAETSKLNTIINEADKEAQRQRKECEVVVNERDILGTQLIRRNEELGLLYEKIRIQRSTLIKGELQYIERVREISTLKRRIRELAAEMGGLQGSVGRSQLARASGTYPRAAPSHRLRSNQIRPISLTVQAHASNASPSVSHRRCTPCCAGSLETLRNEVYQLQRELLQERTKVRTCARSSPPETPSSQSRSPLPSAHSQGTPDLRAI